MAVRASCDIARASCMCDASSPWWLGSCAAQARCKDVVQCRARASSAQCKVHMEGSMDVNVCFKHVQV